MKNLITFLSIIILGQTAFSMTEREITAKVISDAKFVHSVEESIRNTFRQPATVKMQFQSIQAQIQRMPYFYARFEYVIKAEDVQFGLCSYTVLGTLQANSSLVFRKIVHEDCGD